MKDELKEKIYTINLTNLYPEYRKHMLHNKNNRQKGEMFDYALHKRNYPCY